MKEKLFTLLALLAVSVVFWSCDDDEPKAKATTYVGKTAVFVDFNGQYACGDYDATAVMVNDIEGGKSNLAIKPMQFDVTLPNGTSMQVATEEEIVFKDMKTEYGYGVTTFEGNFKGMVKTVMRGQSSPLQMVCSLQGRVGSSNGKETTMTFTMKVEEWGNMPFGMTFNFTASKPQ